MLLETPIINLGIAPEVLFQQLKDAVESLTQDDWLKDSSRQKSFKAHESTEAIPLVSGRDMSRLQHSKLYLEYWQEIIDPILLPIFKKNYGEGVITRMCICKLLPHTSVIAHLDDTEEIHQYSHRTHLPIITNKNVGFYIESERFFLEEKNIYEFSNQQFHHVDNESNNVRVHVIADYMDIKTFSNFYLQHSKGKIVFQKTTYKDVSISD